MKVLKTVIFTVVVLLSFLLSFNYTSAQGQTQTGVVKNIIEENGDYQKLEVVINGQSQTIESNVFDSAQKFKYKKGDKIIISDGFITDFVRNDSLYVLFGIFVALTILIAGKWGLTSLVGMFYSFYIIFVFILPLITKGYDPTISAIIGALFIIPVTFSLSHGINRKTIVAILGTVISMVIIGLLSFIFVNLTKLSGFASEEAGFLQYQLGGIINMKGLLLAGIIISSLGVMDDITISQSSVVEELRKANPKLSKKELFLRSMRVGKDHISSMVNTLILVYAGASLPLMLLFVNNPGHPFSEIVNYEIVADEIVRTMVGSIGLILAVPITTFIAVNTKFKLKLENEK